MYPTKDTNAMPSVAGGHVTVEGASLGHTMVVVAGRFLYFGVLSLHGI